MADHKLAIGKQLIKGIIDLGVILDYHIEKEFPVDESSFGEPPAVDVAWFSKKGDRFPLFIFEVESKATNGMTNNPLKVYAQESKNFEKPLFFFHIVAQGGFNSARPRNLESLFGKHNYRIYMFANHDASEFIKDVLCQHARLRSDLSYIELYETLTSETWANKVNYLQVIKKAVELNLSRENIISSFVSLCRKDSIFFTDLKLLLEHDSKEFFEHTNLYSYLGTTWLTPIISAFFCGLSQTTEEMNHWSRYFMAWQNKSDPMPMISASFGLSLDYDEFLIGCAPQLITLCISLSHKNKTISNNLVKVLCEILDKININWEGLNAAIYLLHISAALNLKKSFDNARDFISNFNNLDNVNIYNPPSCFSFTEKEFNDIFTMGNLGAIPELDVFTEKSKEQFAKQEFDLVNLALKSIDDDAYIFSWSTDLLYALWSEYYSDEHGSNE